MNEPKHTPGQHTPGPWKIGGQGIVKHPVTCAPLLTQRIETKLGTIELIDGTNEPEYNARLIEAAPDLYKALDAIVTAARLVRLRLQTQVDNPANEVRGDVLLQMKVEEMAKTALAKAKGDQ